MFRESILLIINQSLPRFPYHWSGCENKKKKNMDRPTTSSADVNQQDVLKTITTDGAEELATN
jgi:hypothetical protein